MGGCPRVTAASTGVRTKSRTGKPQRPPNKVWVGALLWPHNTLWFRDDVAMMYVVIVWQCSGKVWQCFDNVLVMRWRCRGDAVGM